MPRPASALETRDAAKESLLQVKQCANTAQPRAGPSGESSTPASAAPLTPANLTSDVPTGESLSPSGCGRR